MKYLLVLVVAMAVGNCLNYYDEDALFLIKVFDVDGITHLLDGETRLREIGAGKGVPRDGSRVRSYCSSLHRDPVNNVVNTLTQLYSSVSEVTHHSPPTQLGSVRSQKGVLGEANSLQQQNGRAGRQNRGVEGEPG